MYVSYFQTTKQNPINPEPTGAQPILAQILPGGIILVISVFFFFLFLFFLFVFFFFIYVYV